MIVKRSPSSINVTERAIVSLRVKPKISKTLLEPIVGYQASDAFDVIVRCLKDRRAKPSFSLYRFCCSTPLMMR